MLNFESDVPMQFHSVLTFHLVLQVVQFLCTWRDALSVIVDGSLIYCGSTVDPSLIQRWSIVDLTCSHIFGWDNSWKASILDCNKVTFTNCEYQIWRVHMQFNPHSCIPPSTTKGTIFWYMTPAGHFDGKWFEKKRHSLRQLFKFWFLQVVRQTPQARLF